jgi:peptide/nickel transport system permease protein
MEIQVSDLDLIVSGVGLPRRWGRLREQADVWVPAGVLLLMILACFVLPEVANIAGPNAGALGQARLPPLSAGHLLGTDDLGNDILSRCLYGGRISIEVGLSSVGLGLLVGGGVGMWAGYKGGVTDTLVMRVLDMFLAFPALVLAIAVATYLGPSERDVIFAIAFFTVPAFARLARASTLRVREQGYVMGARLIGQKERRILIGHIVPNVLPSLVTFALLTVALAMIIEAALDFLGVGVRAPTPTWGSIISSGDSDLSSAPWIVIMPAAFLFVTVMSLNLLGDALRSRWEVS